MEDLTLNSANSKHVKESLSRVFINDEEAKKIKDVFIAEMESGLRNGLEGSSLQMENTYVTELISGTEEGRFLALDLGGTNFRVILLDLKAGKIVQEQVDYYSVPDETRLGKGTDLFDFLTDCIVDFCKKQSLLGEHLSLGFTFSFPMTQDALDSGILVNWTKSFNCSGVVGSDAVKLLNESLSKRDEVKIKVVAILNDTTGTLVKGAYDNPKTVIGLILGTGCNGAYLEKTDNIVRWAGHKPPNATEVIVDPEFGAFGDNGCIDFVKSEFDRLVDAGSLFPGSFTFEKYFAGKYIGEIARHMILKLAEGKLLFSGQDVSKLGEGYIFTAEDVSNIEQDSIDGSGKRVADICKRFGLEASADDVLNLKYICSLLTHRCGLLVGIPLAVMISRLGKKDPQVAVTGSLYKYNPSLKSLLEKYIAKFVDDSSIVVGSFLTDDGSGKGAGLIAAIAQRINIRN